jgi:hypothetical protein
MIDMDDILQRQLEALEKGADLDAVVAAIPGDANELAPLIRLAAAVRNLPHPVLLPQRVNQQRALLVAASRKLARPANGRLGFKGWGWALLPTLAGASVVVLVGIFALIALGIWLIGPQGARAATLMEVSGQVEVASSATATDWRPVTDGDRLHAGQRLRTQAASEATLLFYDGSRTVLAPDSDLTLTEVNGGWGKVLRVALTQNNGETNHSVVPLRGANSSFVVLTPAGDARVHGTQFDVSVAPGGWSRFAVTSGQVQVSNASSDLLLAPGQATAAEPGQLLDSPAYQFALQGVLDRLDGNHASVAGVPFNVTSKTVFYGNPRQGAVVRVAGRIVVDGTWVADWIRLAGSENLVATFTGLLGAREGNLWQVGGHAVLVDEQTDLGQDLSQGSPVRVSFVVLQSGEWLAKRIELLVVSSQEPTPTPTATPDPNANPSLSFQPDELQVAGCDQAFQLTGRLANTAGSLKDYAANVVLGYEIPTGADYVAAVNLTPPGWERIEAGQQVDFTIAIALDDAWQTVPPETQVKLRIFIANETNRPGHQRTRLTVTVVAGDCKRTPTPTATMTPTVTLTATLPVTDTVTPTPTLTVTATLTPTLRTDCTGAQPHPEGTRLAQLYGVSYDEIMGWFCQGFGFGEIDQAYSLSQQTGVSVPDIFAMRRSGLGWGEIKQDLLAKPGDGKSTREPKPTKQPGKPDEPPGQSKKDK